jgi:ParB family transcriptional regulator, chromosome partitioning protein
MAMHGSCADTAKRFTRASLNPTKNRTMPTDAMILLDPALVVEPVHLRFRAPQAFADAAFAKLKQSIANKAVNVQPIKVRPLQGGAHELVFGFRRLRACLELGLPVAAVVQEMTGTRVVEELDASNDDNQVSVYERGCLYEAALDAGYYPSRRRLAEALGRGPKDVADAATVAQLPRVILDSLVDPRVLKVSIAKRLAAAAATDPDGVAHRLRDAKLHRSSRVSDLLKALSA